MLKKSHSCLNPGGVGRSVPYDRDAVVGPAPTIGAALKGIQNVHLKAGFVFVFANVIMTIVAFATYDDTKYDKCNAEAERNTSAT